jgi:hypothetical protein
MAAPVPAGPPPMTRTSQSKLLFTGKVTRELSQEENNIRKAAKAEKTNVFILSDNQLYKFMTDKVKDNHKNS